MVTDRGGIRVTPRPEMRPVASESVTRESWSHRVALCLPEPLGAMARRNVLTELGPDEDALRERDRGAVLFDLGLGALSGRCLRAEFPTRKWSLNFAASPTAMSSRRAIRRWVLSWPRIRTAFSSAGSARVEVFQPIPPPNGRSPEGPHTHVLPKLLRHGRTHAATEHIPHGLRAVRASLSGAPGQG